MSDLKNIFSVKVRELSENCIEIHIPKNIFTEEEAFVVRITSFPEKFVIFSESKEKTVEFHAPECYHNFVAHLILNKMLEKRKYDSSLIVCYGIDGEIVTALSFKKDVLKPGVFTDYCTLSTEDFYDKHIELKGVI